MLKSLNYFKKHIKNIVFPESQFLHKNNYKDKFKYNVFKHNNFLILILAYFLFFE